MVSFSHELLDPLLGTVRRAGAIAMRYFGEVAAGDIEHKSDVDLVTHADREVEAFLQRRLAATFPDAAFFGEERGEGAAAAEGHVFVVDPIDGTTNFVHAHPHFAISVALLADGRVEAGVVYCPVFDDMYYAIRGRGAYCNERRLRVSRADTLIDALAATGFAAVRQRRKPDNIPLFTEAIYRLRGVRRAGSAAMDLCFVAEGRLDLFWEYNLQPWDILAGTLLVTEAGGRVSDFTGGPDYADAGKILATNGRLHDDFLALIAEVERKGA